MVRILVVEDERVVAWNIQETLKIFDYEVVANVDSGDEAIRAAQELKPDLVLMDIRLRGSMDGISAARIIQSQLLIPVVYLTAHANDEILQQALDTTPFGYVIKPFNRIDLHATIETALRRHHLEQELQQVRIQLQTTLNSLGDGAIATDVEGRVVLMNEAAEDLTGWSHAESLGKPINQIMTLVHGQTLQVIENPVLLAIREQRRTTLPQDCWLNTRDGRQVPVSYSASPIKNASGQVTGGILLFQDISDRNRSKQVADSLRSNLEEQIQERTRQLQQALDYEATLKRITDKVRDSLDENQILQTAVQELAIATGVRGCNAAVYDLNRKTSTIRYEYTTYPVPFRGNVLKMSNFQEGYNQLLKGQHFQFCGLVPSPVRSRVAMLACPMLDSHGVIGDLWLVNDAGYEFNELEIRLAQQVANQCAIALRQARLYQAVQNQVDELERLNRLKDDFLSSISHELRTPVANIRMAIQMLEIQLRPFGLLEAEAGATRRYLQILQDECQKEIKLISDLLDLSRMEAGTESLSLSCLNLSTWLPVLVKPFQKLAESHQQTFNLQLVEPLPLLTTDEGYLQRAIAELLNNACKYTPSHETITLAAIPFSTPEGTSTTAVSAQTTVPRCDRLRIEVVNTGVEVPPSELPYIFDKFYRIPNIDPWQHSGTGLGLALVKKLVEQLGATITVESHSNRTVFAIEFDASHLDFN